MTFPSHIDLREQADQLVLSGARLIAQDHAQEAILILRQALALQPCLAEAHYQLGHALQQSDQPQQAQQAYRQALSCNEAHVPTWLRLAELYREEGRLNDAAAAYRRALALRPDLAEIHHDLGMLLDDMGHHVEAESAYRQAIRHRPGFAQAHQNLGTLMVAVGRLSDAEQSCRHALALQPESALAHACLASVLILQNKLPQGESHYRKAVALDPHNARLQEQLGAVLHRQNKFAQAESVYRRVLDLNPGDWDTWSNLGVVLDSLNRLSESEAALRRAFALRPQSPDIRFGLAFTLLRQGRLAEAWPLYESRYDPDRQTLTRWPMPTTLNYPQWQGESLQGKSLVIWQEQGFGDMIQFARYLPRLKALGASRIILVCQHPLKPLFEGLPHVDAVVGTGKTATMQDAQALIGYDYWTLIMSLPHLLNTATFDDIPPAVYVQAAPARLAKWRRQLDSLPGIKVGLTWKGNAQHLNDGNRSLSSLHTLAPLWQVPGVSFVSVQKGQGEDEARRLADDQPLLHLGSDIADFADSAAIIAQLDLLISVDTAAVHLAGALGVPCWTLIPVEGTDWRWVLDGETTPWYPGTMRLFRQTTAGDWDGPVEQLCQALFTHCLERNAASSR
ncbi:MAG: tetratricopeptide repeat protein [Bordetella sp.]|uniref:tetratricopeptide repeat protein n=1 Tax=Bordetella sp. TaxID=28081 RepID=UPI003F7C55C8